MGTTSPRRLPTPLPSFTASHSDKHQHSCSPDDDDNGSDDLELTPLLPRRRRGSNRASTGCPRTERPALTQPPPQRARRAPHTEAAKAAPAPCVRWHEMAFGSVRVPSAMDMREIRRRLQARRSADEPAAPGWAPWRLIRWLSCKGVEAVTVAAAAAPVRLV